METSIFLLGIALFICAPFSTGYCGNFQIKFGRGMFHWPYVFIFIGLLFCIASDWWIAYTAIPAFFVLFALHAKKYGFGWAVAIASYTFTICLGIFLLINALNGLKNKK